MANGIFILEDYGTARFHGARFGGCTRDISGSSHPQAYVNLCNMGLAKLTQEEVNRCRNSHEFFKLAFNAYDRQPQRTVLEEKVKVKNSNGSTYAILAMAIYSAGCLGYAIYNAEEDSSFGKFREQIRAYFSQPAK